jgi:hypothetical protein
MLLLESKKHHSYNMDYQNHVLLLIDIMTIIKSSYVLLPLFESFILFSFFNYHIFCYDLIYHKRF